MMKRFPFTAFSELHFKTDACIIAGHLPSEGRVGEGKDEGRIGFFEGIEGKEKEVLVQKILLRRKNEGRC